jgi:DNA-binding NarL/FixJ family response regulator
MPSLRVLVVDDFEPFRQFVCATLKTMTELQVVGEASDGLDAVAKAQALQPDLILLDIGLPTLSGIEAARQIRKLSPESKILFLSQHAFVEVAQEALSLGALGYVVKADAGSELLAAVDAVRQGKQYLGSRLSTRRSAEATTIEASKRPLLQTGNTCNHAVQFHSDDESLVGGFTAFIETALKAGNAVIALMTASHLNSLFLRLQAQELDISTAISEGRYIPLDVADTLATFMVNDLPDPVRLRNMMGNLVAAAAKAAKGDRPRVVACGEAAPTLLAQGKPDAAIRLEHLWDEMAKACELDTLCGYVLTRVQREHESDIYDRICAEHLTVFSDDISSGL